jgi:hypothetical protein
MKVARESAAMTAPMTMGSVPAQAERGRPASAPDWSGSSTSSAARPDRMMRACCDCWVPSHVTIRRLPPMAPTIAPTVLAA